MDILPRALLPVRIHERTAAPPTRILQDNLHESA